MLSGLFGSSSQSILKSLENYPSTYEMRKVLKDPKYKELCTLLDGPGGKTFFCPINCAMKELYMGQQHFGAPLECFALDLLNCHLVPDKAVSPDDFPCLVENNCKNPQWVNKGGHGQIMKLENCDGHMFVNFGIPGWPMWTAKIWQADIPCSNGKLYLISKVLRFPYSTSSMAKLQGQGISFRYGVEDYNLSLLSNCKTNISVFVPKSEAFDLVVAKDLGPEIMKDTLMAHHVKGCYYSTDLKDGMKLETFNGHGLVVSKKEGEILINGVPVIEADVVCKNGVIHFIDDVLPLDKKTEESKEYLEEAKDDLENLTLS
jgi:uncharacterized surface protein with fasciclin (FAS1) repeats